MTTMTTMGTKYPEIFAALFAQFSSDEIKRRPGKGGITLLYITARQAMNRLDDVLGPENWEDTYTETKDGIRCRITIVLPDGQHVAKEDGAGFRDMTDENDAEKSAFSEAFKRAAVKFGVGRHLYKDGVPKFVYDTLGINRKEQRP